LTKTIILLPLKNPRFKEIPIVNKKIEKFLLNCSIFVIFHSGVQQIVG